ncbi:MAG TPA: AAA family ATPase [Candidatus Saccharimonadales bacterium]|nr:AAA family ATPase [Candidatus Saccharimonadales bacterium]
MNIDDLPLLPDAVTALRENHRTPATDDATPISSRADLFSLGGTWRYHGLSEAQILLGLRERFEEDRIFSSDPARPWTDADLVFIAHELGKKKAGDPTAKAMPVNGATPQRPGAATDDLPSAADIKPRKVRWMWTGYIALGKLTILDGRPGVFKSGTAFDLAARATVGAKMPDGSESDFEGPVDVLIISGEDDPEDTIVPRLIAAGADLSRVHFLDDLTLPTGFAALERRVRQYDARFLLIDPLVAFVSVGFNLYHDQQSRRALKPLADVAKRTGCAVLGLRHTKKGSSGSAQEGGSGSVAIGGAARSNLLAAPDPDEADRFILASVKNNLGKKPVSIAYGIEERGVDTEDGVTAVPRLVWQGETTLTADDLMSGTEKQGEAIAFLTALLADGPVLASEVKKAADGMGLSWSGAVRRASNRLKVNKRQAGFGKKSYWSLNDFGNVVQPVQPVLNQQPPVVEQVVQVARHIKGRNSDNGFFVRVHRQALA